MIIGSASYEDPAIADLPSAARSAQALHNVLTDPARGGLPAAHCRLLTDPRTSVEVVEAIEQAAAEAEDLLLVCFVGHGLRSGDGALHLAVRESRKSHARLSAIPLGAIRDAFGANAATKVLVVDSCFSAQALKEMMSGDPLAEVVVTFKGVFVAASADVDKTASAPVGERYTAFTEVLLDVVQSGIPGHGEVLTFSAVMATVHGRLVAAGRPMPLYASRDRAGELGMVRNAAADAPSAVPAAPKPKRVKISSAYPRMNVVLWVLLWAVSFLIVFATLDSVHHQFTFYSWAAVPSVLLAIVVPPTFPFEHVLTVDDRGMTLRTGGRDYRVDWINVAQVRLAERKPGRFVLQVQLLPGAALPRSPRWNMGPRRAESPNEYVFARTRLLAATPVAVDDVLRDFAGHTWRRNQTLDETRLTQRAELLAAKVFRTRRGRCLLCGAVLTAIGMTPLLGLLATEPLLAMVTDAVTALVAVAPGSFLLLCARWPAELRVDADGLRATRFGRQRTFAWCDIEKVSLIRPSRLPLTPWHVQLRLASAEITLIDTVSLSTRRAALVSALATHAGSRWDATRQPDQNVHVRDNATQITGRVAGLPTMIVPPVLWAALLTGYGWLIRWSAGSDLIGGPAALFGFLIVTGVAAWAVLPLRQRWTLTLTADAVEIRVWHRLIRIRWDDVRYVRLVGVETPHPSLKKAKPFRHTEIRIVPNRGGAFRRRWDTPLFLVPVHDVYRLCVLDKLLFHLDASADTVDRELRRRAGLERWRPRTEEKP